MAVVLTGCDIAEEAAGTAKRLDQANQFGEVRREADPTDPKGRRFSIKVEAKQEASWHDAMRVMGEAGLYSVMASFNDRHPKYSAIAKAVGELHARGHRYCRGQGVAFPRLLVMSLPTPTPEEDVFLNRSDAFVGAEFSCMDGEPADESL
tara:strand:+ start:1696 stop:2145 length:450 start_codon:yes stop_codon:yes gene_type:complete